MEVIGSLCLCHRLEGQLVHYVIAFSQLEHEVRLQRALNVQMQLRLHTMQRSSLQERQVPERRSSPDRLVGFPCMLVPGTGYWAVERCMKSQAYCKHLMSEAVNFRRPLLRLTFGRALIS